MKNAQKSARANKKSARRGAKGRWIRTVALIFVCALLLGSSALLLYVQRVSEGGIDPSLFRAGEDRKPTRIFVTEQGVVRELEGERISVAGTTEYVYLKDTPQDLIDAFVAIEDKRFYEHNGVDWYRTAGALLNYFLDFGSRFGASTITQQLIKNVTGDDEISIERKIREIKSALELEEIKSKDEIMELYLNVINFSDGCTGIGCAAKRYFSKSADSLSLIECAALAAITNNPSYYNPITHPENNAKRRDLIISEMYAQGMITEGEYLESYGSELILCPDDSIVEDGVHSWYVDMVIEDVIDDLVTKRGMSRSGASSLVFGGGLDIYIQMDTNIQRVMDEYYENVDNFPSAEGAQSAMIMIDPENGDILGVVGAIGEKSGNRVQSYATDTLRSPGSTIKPLSVYAPALERGIINYASVYDDVPFRFYENADGSYTPWPKNANGVYHGLSTMSYCIANSTNTVPLRILDELGLSHSFYFLKDYLHLDDLIAEGENKNGEFITDMDYAALALGQLNYGISVRDITAAYSILADGGVYHAPRSYSLVKSQSGEVLLKKGVTNERVISEGNAEIMTKLLSTVAEYGTASDLKIKNKVAIACKTGTTQGNMDRWCIGYTPSLLCGVWYGYEYPREIPRAEKNHFLNAFDAVLSRIYEEDVRSKYKDGAFDESGDLVAVNYCMDSGLLPCEACIKDARGSRIALGYFVKGTEPSELCDKHVLVEYDAVCGGIATVFTPRGHIAEVGMIEHKREFPVQITVSDAQYVYLRPSVKNSLSFDENTAFFDVATDEKSRRFFGRSAGKRQFNRLSTAHFSYSDLVFCKNLLKNQN